jgi:hypothetical protein
MAGPAAASTAPASSTATTPPTTADTAPYWLISLNAIDLLKANGASGALIKRLFDNRHSYIIVGPRQANPLAKALTVENFTNFGDDSVTHVQGIVAAISDHRLVKGVDAISYDNENWAFTPRPEIADPVGYTKRASDLAHQAGLAFISTPGMDLGTSPSGRIQALPQSFYTFVSDGYLSIAKYDDLFELQLENAETMPYFASLSLEAERQVRSINPKALFLLQLTSNPNKQPVSVQQLIDDFRATRGFVDGYALTIPNSAAICPSCGKPRVATMLDFLEWYSQSKP